MGIALLCLMIKRQGSICFVKSNPLTLKMTYSIFVYCSIVAPQLVGHERVLLLRIIQLNDHDNFRITRDYSHPHYVPISLHYIDTIEIDMRDSYGQSIRFSNEKPVMMKLHFRSINKFAVR